ncbi:10269_t:CDS:2 [Acaulospora morrowiae]|uniref:10269_t:CDS:1 n=1 Tax=Acaulospora morrowiae TaxID=94023 RepID=A0A9N9BEG6_9GLOM|nr:10269_t:CDS:2 [Acaulospora morrowiae]
MVRFVRIPTYEQFDKMIDKTVKENGKNIYVLLFGTEDPSTGSSWCPDCVIADPLIRRHFSNEAHPESVLVEVPVGTRSQYKGRPDNPYRTHPRIQLKAIPTLIKWSANGSDDKSLVEDECSRDDMLKKFFSE